MVKPEWGTKHGCPKCGTRFYDLGKDDPVHCIDSECGHEWYPEPVLKTKQPIPFEEAEKEKAKESEDLADDDDLDIDEDAETSPDNEVDLGGDDDLGVKTSDDDDKEDN